MMGSTNVAHTLPYLADAEMNNEIEVKPVDNELFTRFKRRIEAAKFRFRS